MATSPLEIARRPAVRPPSRRRAQARVRHHVLGEGLFGDALVRERKRADRFVMPFAVLLVDRGDSSPEEGRWVSILRAVATVKRDIDIVGWLEQCAVLGL